MKVTLWGTRGSLASPGPETIRYGGNTSCVGVEGRDGILLVLDSGSGIRRLSNALPDHIQRVDILLTHLHMDHIQGLGFFRPLRSPDYEVHIWGPASSGVSLWERLTRYLSPPLFPVRLRDLPCQLQLHESAGGSFEIGDYRVSTDFVCHLDPTLGYRIEGEEGSIAYLPDHEPFLAAARGPVRPDWTSGYGLAAGVDLLIHDAQYTADEYNERVGWGHSSMAQAFQFAALAEARRLVPFHHDPTHSDRDLDLLITHTITETNPPFPVTPGIEGASFEIG